MVKKAFLSSVSGELAHYRNVVYNAVQRLDDWVCLRMEDFGARCTSPEDFSRKCAKECDLFILVVGHRYGSIPSNSEESFTEMEYNAARKKGIPMLVFVAPDDLNLGANTDESEENREKQKLFRKRVGGQLVVDMDWRTPEQLATRVTLAIANIVPDLLKRARRKKYLHALIKVAVFIGLLFTVGLVVRHFAIPPELGANDKKYLEFVNVYTNSEQAYKLHNLYQLDSLATIIMDTKGSLPADSLGQLYFWWGYAEYELEKYENAKHYFMKAINANPKEAAYYSKLAWTHYVLKEFDDAERICRQGLEIDPHNGELINLQNILAQVK